ncbi:adenosylcobinamide-GDP ribazoletransferase [Paracoccus jiaweipingae]|uniref:adenosylcobinamide-GDP ribazoletransferase n=1 Tax=unclassified Paracoccus (in: a-proteobacteria) TaxID=2688777 RepID=UPI0037A2FE6D
MQVLKNAFQNLVLAMVFLTVLPLGRFLPARVLTLGPAVWAFPLAGLAVAVPAALPLLAGLPPLLAAALTLAGLSALTGALHEDATADFADSFGGRDRAARLAIMRDSRIGSFGTVALIAVFAIRLTALAGTAVPVAALIGAAMTGRALMGLALMAMPPARHDGLGQGAGPVPPLAALLAVGLALTGVLAGCGVTGLLALVPAALAALSVAGLAWRRLGGQTGDVLGCICLTAETAFLSAMAGL